MLPNVTVACFPTGRVPRAIEYAKISKLSLRCRIFLGMSVRNAGSPKIVAQVTESEYGARFCGGTLHWRRGRWVDKVF